MRKALGTKLEKKQVGLSYVTPGLYMPNYLDYIVLPDKKRQEQVDLLDAKDLATQINA